MCVEKLNLATGKYHVAHADELMPITPESMVEAMKDAEREMAATHAADLQKQMDDLRWLHGKIAENPTRVVAIVREGLAK